MRIRGTERVMRRIGPLAKPLWNKGFRVQASLSGRHEFASGGGPAGEFPFSLEMDWGPERVAAFLNPFNRDAFLTAAVRGVIRAGAWVEEAPCEGTLELGCVSGTGARIRLYFNDAGGSPCEFIGRRSGLRPWNLHRPDTAWYGVIYNRETGREISRSLSRPRFSVPIPVLFGRSRNSAQTPAR